MVGRQLIVLPCALIVAACASHGTTPLPPSSGPVTPAQLAKTDIDRVAEAHHREIFHNLKILTEKLYRRNPRELRKSGRPTVDAGVARLFHTPHRWRFVELKGARGTDAIHLAFREDYHGDRVLAFMGGLGGMIQRAFNDKVEFFALDDLDPQRLYNAARNVEIAVWKLSNAQNSGGQPYLLSNETSGPVINLSFEREFGKVIASLDVLSKIAAEKENRTVVKAIQSLATAVFLPIK